MMVSFKTGDELTQGATAVGTVMAQPMRAGEGAFIRDLEDFDAEARDQKTIEREIKAHTGTYSEADAQKIVADVLAKCESDHVKGSDPRQALRFLASWR